MCKNTCQHTTSKRLKWMQKRAVTFCFVCFIVLQTSQFELGQCFKVKIGPCISYHIIWLAFVSEMKQQEINGRFAKTRLVHLWCGVHSCALRCFVGRSSTMACDAVALCDAVCDDTTSIHFNVFTFSYASTIHFING